MSAVSSGQNEHHLSVLRRRFREWRGHRPFWAGLLTLLGGIPIAYFPYASFQLGQLTLSMATTAGAASLIIGVLLMSLGLTMWFQYLVRVFAGVAAILLALVSIPVANLGGFFIGFLLALTGGALSISWAPGKDAPAAAAQGGAAPGDGAGAGYVPEQREVAERQDAKDVRASHPNIEANGGRNSAG
ncbi:DUF6114 domain-containing protein [Streptomyces sp. SP18CS02]|uniref:DUF6114 domain-containing protein n=1 Tax=Streptomyces sp. SP18CS02 TaxID=3002531 RepID=UPI002E7A5268|nr:DUF6114 domain-containing protein [Streptomyces sp. SP18CS02]MEE1757129.1 DUF6114 domain-containing protein [Streptomyces sp. SP18CS02]